MSTAYARSADLQALSMRSHRYGRGQFFIGAAASCPPRSISVAKYQSATSLLERMAINIATSRVIGDQRSPLVRLIATGVAGSRRRRISDFWRLRPAAILAN